MDFPDLTDPSDWPPSFPSLRDLDRELRCPICSEFFVSAVSLPCCGFSFCSLCLRSSLPTRDSKCPNHLCMKDVSESSIRSNLVLNRVVEAWNSSRMKLLEMVKQSNEMEQLKTAWNSLDSSSITRSSVSGSRANQIQIDKPRNLDSLDKSKSIELETFDDNKIKEKNDLPAITVFNPPQSEVQILTNESRTEFHQTDVSSSTQVQSDDDDFKADRCIICKSQISPARMELHVQMHFAAEDRENRSKTLENESKRKSVAAPQPEKESKKPLPKLNYHIMQLKEIRTRCDALKLNSTGKKEKLIQRHRTYTLLFNANLDATNPKSEEELKKEVMRKEGGILAEAQSSMFNGVNGPSVREPIKSEPTIGQRINKKTDPGLIDKVLKDYEVSHMKQFSDLIAKAKMAASKDKEAREIAVAKPLPMALEDQAQEQQKLQSITSEERPGCSKSVYFPDLHREPLHNQKEQYPLHNLMEEMLQEPASEEWQDSHPEEHLEQQSSDLLHEDFLQQPCDQLQDASLSEQDDVDVDEPLILKSWNAPELTSFNHDSSPTEFEGPKLLEMVKQSNQLEQRGIFVDSSSVSMSSDSGSKFNQIQTDRPISLDSHDVSETKESKKNKNRKRNDFPTCSVLNRPTPQNKVKTLTNENKPEFHQTDVSSFIQVQSHENDFKAERCTQHQKRSLSPILDSTSFSRSPKKRKTLPPSLKCDLSPDMVSPRPYSQTEVLITPTETNHDLIEPDQSSPIVSVSKIDCCFSPSPTEGKQDLIEPDQSSPILFASLSPNKSFEKDEQDLEDSASTSNVLRDPPFELEDLKQLERQHIEISLLTSESELSESAHEEKDPKLLAEENHKETKRSKQNRMSIPRLRISRSSSFLPPQGETVKKRSLPNGEPKTDSTAKVSRRKSSKKTAERQSSEKQNALEALESESELNRDGRRMSRQITTPDSADMRSTAQDVGGSALDSTEVKNRTPSPAASNVKSRPRNRKQVVPYAP